MIVAGQVHGGIAQAVGQALMERVVYDGDGQLLTGSFMDYGLPRADDLPSFVTYTDESQPCKINPLGAKGVGELGTVGGDADGHQRDRRCVASARCRRHRDAGDAGARLARDSRCAQSSLGTLRWRLWTSLRRSV